MKYRLGGKEKLLSIGAYPALGLAAARDKRSMAKALLAEGNDPMRTRPKASTGDKKYHSQSRRALA